MRPVYAGTVLRARYVVLGLGLLLLLFVACKKTPLDEPAPASSVVFRASPAPENSSEPVNCSHQFVTDEELRSTPEATPITSEELFAKNPRLGRFTIEGFLHSAFHCAPCPPGALCKPCEETILLSRTAAPDASLLTDSVDFVRIAVPDATHFKPQRRYRMTFAVCANGPQPPQPANRELRGYREL